MRDGDKSDDDSFSGKPFLSLFQLAEVFVNLVGLTHLLLKFPDIVNDHRDLRTVAFLLYHPEQFIEIVDGLGVTEKIVRDSDATGALLLFCRAHLQINKNDLLRLVLILFLGRQETILSASSDMDSRLERKG